MAMRIAIGTSGYSYKEWKGSFYPDDLPASGMLAYYAGRFDTVEANNTFYRMPEPRTLERWAAEVPAQFTFAVKAPQRITHQKKLVETGEDVRYLFEILTALGPKLGPVLFQLPPFLRRDLDRLAQFLRILPRDCRIAFEFRHASWNDESVHALLRQYDAALCCADTDESPDPDSVLVPTASWGYLRLRRSEYGTDALSAWAERVKRQPWTDAFVYFKHEDEGKGPAFGEQFRIAVAGTVETAGE